MTELRLEPIIEGNEAGETILFVQGWPDDASIWDEAVRALAPTYRCVRVDMPNYGDTARERWGYRTEEIVDALATLMRTLGAERPITLVLHDWGSYWGHFAHHRVPEAVKRVAALDVAPHYKASVGAALGIVTYQSWLAGAFFVGGPIGNWMTRSMAKLANAPARERPLEATINYPYRNVWGDLAGGRARRMSKGYWPTCPLLFVYGAKKPFMFHSQNWLDHVARVGGEVVALPCGHWVQRHPDFVPTLTRWLAQTK